MNKKKKYIKPTSDLIQIASETALATTSLDTNGANHTTDQSSKTEGTGSSPISRGDAGVDPSSDIGFGAKVNPWGAWDEY